MFHLRCFGSDLSANTSGFRGEPQAGPRNNNIACHIKEKSNDALLLIVLKFGATLNMIAMDCVENVGETFTANHMRNKADVVHVTQCRNRLNQFV